MNCKTSNRPYETLERVNNHKNNKLITCYGVITIKTLWIDYITIKINSLRVME